MGLNIILIGNGMYVCGRGTKDFGAILPAILEYKRNGGNVIEIHMVGTRKEHSLAALAKANELMSKTGVSIKLSVYPDNVEENPDTYKNVLDLIDGPGCALVCVPDHLHFQITRDCLLAGLHTLVVKPLTPTVNEAIDLIKLAKEKYLYGAVEFHKRFDRQNLKIKEAITNCEIGTPLYFEVDYSQRKNMPLKTFSSWVNKTNIFQYLGVHYVDIIYYTTGATPKKVLVHGQTEWLKEQGIDTYDAIHTTIEWELQNGRQFLSFIHTNWIDPENTSAMSDQRIKVVGTKGRIESNQKKRGLEKVTDLNGIEDINPDFCNTFPLHDGNLSYQGYGIDSINTFLKDSQNIINGNFEPAYLEGKRSTFLDSLTSTAVVEAVNKGLKTDCEWIEIEI